MSLGGEASFGDVDQFEEKEEQADKEGEMRRSC